MVNDLDIKSQKQLSKHENLYAELIYSLDNFIISIALRSHSNTSRILNLNNLGVDYEDVHYDILDRCINKLDLILANNLKNMIPYIYAIINNRLTDMYRNAIREYNTTISLNKAIQHRDDDDSNTPKTLEDCIPDKKVSVELQAIIKDEILGYFFKYRNNPDALLCVIATKILNDTPKEIAQVLLSTGSVSKALILYQNELSIIYNIEREEFPSIAHTRKTGLSKILASEKIKTKVLSSKISNIIFRMK